MRREKTMFETSVVQARAKAAARRPLLLSVSIAAHAAVIIGVVATSVATVSLPKRAPNQVTFPVIDRIPPLKGDDVTKTATHAAVQPQPVKRATMPTTPTAPQVVPDHVVPAPAQTADSGPIGDSNPGPATGNTGTPGVPWGSKDGVDVDGPPATTAPPKIYTVGEGVKAPVVLRRVSPPYPEIARRMHLNGFVVLECIIDQSGQIRDAKVVSSSSAMFEQPALDAVKQWQFAPGTFNGRPVDVLFDLTVSFHLN